MNAVALPQLRGHDLLTHSRMSCFKTCPKQHLYRYELGVRRARSAQPLRIGGAVHVGLDQRAQGRAPDESIAKAIQSYEVVPAWANTDEAVSEWMVERATVACLLNGYFWYWEGVEAPPEITVAEVIETEIAFELPIRNPETGATTPTFRVAGKRDKIVRLGDGRLAVMEHKTTGDDISPTSDYWTRLRIDQQISLYFITALAQGHVVETVLYDVIRKPKISPRQIPLTDKDGFKIVRDTERQRVYLYDKKGVATKPRESADAEKGWTLVSRTETPDEFSNRLRNDIAERPDFYFARQEIPRLTADLDEFRHELWQQQQSIRESQRTGRWYRNTSACLLMGACEYLEVCHNGIDATNPPSGFEVVQDVHPELSTGD